MYGTVSGRGQVAGVANGTVRVGGAADLALLALRPAALWVTVRQARLTRPAVFRPLARQHGFRRSHHVGSHIVGEALHKPLRQVVGVVVHHRARVHRVAVWASGGGVLVGVPVHVAELVRGDVPGV